MTGAIIAVSIVGLMIITGLLFYASDRSDKNHEVRKSDLKFLKMHVGRAEGALDDVERALDSYAGLDIVGAALAQDVRNIIRNHRHDLRKIEEKRNK